MLNGVMTVILRYLSELVYDVAVKQLPRYLLLIIYDHIKTICAIIKRLFGQNKLITWFDGRRCIDDSLCAWIRPSIDIYSRNYKVGSMGVGTGLYMYDVVVKSSRSLSHLLMSSCFNMEPRLYIYQQNA